MTKNNQKSTPDNWEDIVFQEGVGFKTGIKYLVIKEKDLQDLLLSQKKEMIEKTEKLITEEMLICHKENTPTSRLTSLIMKLKTL